MYGASLMFLFFASFAPGSSETPILLGAESFWREWHQRHHAIKGPKPLMDLLRTLDYVAIYFLIPGTMVPAGCPEDSMHPFET